MLRLEHYNDHSVADTRVLGRLMSGFVLFPERMISFDVLLQKVSVSNKEVFRASFLSIPRLASSVALHCIFHFPRHRIKMAIRRSNRGTVRGGAAVFRGPPALSTRRGAVAARRRERVQKPASRARGNRTEIVAISHLSAMIDQQGSILEGDAERHNKTFPGLEKHKKVLRTKGSISACSELSLAFISRAQLETDEDTNNIALNIMDHFLFTNNWLPALSYCTLHAACFLFASRLTGKANSVEQVAESLGPETEFVQLMASLGEDEEAVAAIAYTISVDAPAVESGYALLYERKEQLGKLTGVYAAIIAQLPTPGSGAEEVEVEPSAALEDIDFDRYR